jgi:hypothetical protein
LGLFFLRKVVILFLLIINHNGIIDLEFPFTNLAIGIMLVRRSRKFINGQESE